MQSHYLQLLSHSTNHQQTHLFPLPPPPPRLPSAETGHSVASPTCLSTIAHSWSGINAEHAVCKSPWTECCQVKRRTWKGINDLRGTEGEDVARLEKLKSFCPQECHNVVVTARSTRSARSHRMTQTQRHLSAGILDFIQNQRKCFTLFLFLLSDSKGQLDRL